MNLSPLSELVAAAFCAIFLIAAWLGANEMADAVDHRDWEMAFGWLVLVAVYLSVGLYAGHLAQLFGGK